MSYLSYANTILANSPQIFLEFQEIIGTVATDSSTHSRNGTYVGGISLAQLTLLSLEPSDYSVLFNDTTGRVTTSYTPFSTTTTVEGYAYRNSTASNDTVFGTDGGSNQVICRANSGGTDISFWNNAAVGAVTWSAACPTASAFHYALTYTDSTKVAELFINGVSQGTKTLSGALTGTPGNICWGSWGGGNDWFGGRQAFAAAYTNVLSSTTIMNDFLAGTLNPYCDQVGIRVAFGSTALSGNPNWFRIG
jgi:hypothetical protein